MAYNFNADEILKLAEEIERNGARFYTLAAEQSGNPSTRKFFSELAAMEVAHEKVFSSLRSKLTAQEQAPVSFDPEGETAQYLKALAGVSVIDEKAKNAFALAEKLSDQEGLSRALKAAIDLEKDSVVFYLGLKEMVPRSMGQERVDEIIREEMRHIRILASRLSSLQP
jgi:rubrerythrin